MLSNEMQLHLVPAESVRKDSLEQIMFVSILENGMMYVKKSSQHLDLQGQFVRFYLSPERKDILAWTLSKTIPMNTMKEYRQFRLSSQNQLMISCQKALSKSGKGGKKYLNLEVKIYDDKSLIAPNKYYYVELK